MFLYSQAVSRLAVAGLFLFTISFFITACSSVSFNDALRNSSQIPDKAKVAGVPFYPQDAFQCGPATLAMVLSWNGLRVSPDELASEVYTSKKEGSLQSDLVGSVRRHGYIAYPFSGPDLLFTEVAAGRPVIVLLNLAFFWYPQWHYAVVIGYDSNTETIILHSGTRAEEKLSFRVFSNLWARSDYWGLLILPPSEIPVHPDEGTWLAAIVGLERAEQWHAAAVAYDIASERWPHNHSVWVGLGNSRYALQDFAGAVSAFREAIRVLPESGIAYNNLALVLAQTGQYEEAQNAAEQAVSLGGPLLETYRKTLSEITSHKQQVPQNQDIK